MGNFSELPYYHTFVVFASPQNGCSLMTPVVAAWSDHAPSQSSGMPSSLVTSFVSCRVKPWIWNVEQFVTTVLFKWNLKWYFTTCQSITKKAHPTFKKKREATTCSINYLHQPNKQKNKTKNKNMYHPMIADFTEIFGMDFSQTNRCSPNKTSWSFLNSFPQSQSIGKVTFKFSRSFQLTQNHIYILQNKLNPRSNPISTSHNLEKSSQKKCKKYTPGD